MIVESSQPKPIAASTSTSQGATIKFYFFPNWSFRTNKFVLRLLGKYSTKIARKNKIKFAVKVCV